MVQLYSVFSNAFKEEVAVNNNHSILFRAIRNKQWGMAIELLRTNPDDAEIWSSRTAHDGDMVWNRLPIHQACINRAPIEIIRALLEVYPEGVIATDLNNRLPIHYVIVYGGTVEVVELLIDACPGTVELPDIYGKTPLMCLTSCSPLGSNIDTYNKAMHLLSKPFDGPTVKTFSGQLNAFDEDMPSDQNSTDLFRAIKNKKWEETMKLIGENPAKSKIWTQHVAWDGETAWRRLPIHEACINNAPITVIQALIEAFRESTEKVDLNKRLPLHHAAVHGAKLEVIELLLESYPASIEMEDSFGKTPLKCLSPPSQSEFSTYGVTMEALSRKSSYFTTIPQEVSTSKVSEEESNEESRQTNNIRIQEQEQEVRTTDITEGASNEDSAHVENKRIQEQEQKFSPTGVSKEASYEDVNNKYIQEQEQEISATELSEELSHEESTHEYNKRIQEQEQEVSATGVSEEMPNENSKQVDSVRIQELEFELQKEREEKELMTIMLQQKLERSLTQSMVLESLLEKKTLENSKLKHTCFNLKKELFRIQVDVLGQKSGIDEEKMEMLSVGTSMASFDTRSKSMDIENITVKDRNLRNLRAEVKERELVIERALMRARSPMSLSFD